MAKTCAKTVKVCAKTVKVVQSVEFIRGTF